MRAMDLSAGTTLLAAAAIGGFGMSPAQADVNNPAINGTFQATSNGEWARSNDTYHDEATIRSTWTIASSCVNPNNCAGTVVSDQGWTANITRVAGMWKVIRYLPNWETCGDGTAASGRQVFTFYPIGTDMTLPVDPNSRNFSGEEVTTGRSGSCGVSDELQITIPFKLVPLD